MVAPYSPRAVPGAVVSMPLTWDELSAAEPFDFRMDTVLGRLKTRGDPWQTVLGSKRDLPLELTQASSGSRVR